jgi:acyl-coenzyme A thioesterase PaaI-like protein
LKTPVLYWTGNHSILFIDSESLIETSDPSCTTMSLPPTNFEDASRIKALGTHEYRIKVHPDFAWGSVAHGGYLFSLLWKAIAEHYRNALKSYDQPDTVAMHVELLRPVPLGEAVIQIKDVRLGKGSSTVHVALTQGGKERVVGYAT